ncbi:NAD(P)-binding domain-containig protein [Rhizobium etli bv. mimosae str. IE4771]|uniref:NAD(P)-binding domain-containig protein n=1 Tax=Rhizobium etli bv. mimosae str. IE4771 TaxID=1432050 RepID=A0A060I2B7_RHIET|nr:NAD(P)-binding domain-containig protein [Rhizobium sp. IE4771]
MAKKALPFVRSPRSSAVGFDAPAVSLSREEVAQRFGFDVPSSSAHTRAFWDPTEPGLLADIDHPAHFGE